MYKLYGGRYTRSGLVEQVMAECGVEYELIEINTAKGEQRSAEFLKINPTGWVPALVTDDGTCLYETPAINLYLAETHLPGELVPMGSDPARGPFLSGLFYIVGMIEPTLKRYWFPDRYADGNNNADIVRQVALDEVVGYFTVINDQLSADGPFHLGERYSLVDLMVAYWSQGFIPPDNIDHLSSISRCRELVYQRPKIKDMAHDMKIRIKEYNEIRSKGLGFGAN